MESRDSALPCLPDRLSACHHTNTDEQTPLPNSRCNNSASKLSNNNRDR